MQTQSQVCVFFGNILCKLGESVLRSLLAFFLRLICRVMVTVMCCQVFHSWILVMDPKCLALIGVNHVRRVASAVK